MSEKLASLQRYDVAPYGDTKDMRKSTDGDWVLFEDVEAALAEPAQQTLTEEQIKTEWETTGQDCAFMKTDIDFAREKAYLPYGVIGIKVWIYRGDVFEATKKEEQAERARRETRSNR